MTRGDILKILRHIDANWAIVKNLSSGFEGMCPKNYMQLIAEGFKESIQDSQTKEISKDVHNKEGLKNDYGKVFKDFHAKDIQIEEESKVLHTKEGFKRSHSRQSSKGSIISDSPPWESPNQFVDLGTPSSHVVSERKPRLLVQSTVHERSRSSSPFGSSGKRRSYNKEDFGSIRKQDVEPILAKNMASLDATIKVNTPTGAEKKTIESVFAERELESIKSNTSTGSDKTSSRSAFLERQREVSSTVSTSLLHIDQPAKPRRPVSDPLLHLSVENASCEDANFTGSSTPQPLHPSQLKPEPVALVQKPKIQAPKPGIAAKPELHTTLRPETEIMKPEIVSPKPGISALKLERPVAAPRTTTTKPSIPPRMRLTKRASCSSLTPSSSDSKSSASSMSAAGSVSSGGGGGGGSLPASPPIAHSRGTSLLAGTPISLSPLNSTQNSQLLQQNTSQSSQLSSQVSLLDESEGTLLADTTDILTPAVLTPMAAVSTSTPPGSAAVPPVLTSVQHILMPTPAASTQVPTVTTSVSHPPSESVYARICKPSQPQQDRDNKQPAQPQAPSLPRGDSVGNVASFPEDVSHVSSDGPYASG